MIHFENLLEVCVRDEPDVAKLKLDTPLEFVKDEESLVRFECRNPKCHFATEDTTKLFKHEQGCRSETEINCQQIPMHRPCTKIRDELVAEGILPEANWHNWHFATFDVECFMDDVHTELGVRSIHRLVSIAVKSSFGDLKEHYFERMDMNPWSVKVLVQDFLSTLVYLRGEMFKHLPKSVIEGHKKYLAIVKSPDFRKQSVVRQKKVWDKLRFLTNCLALRIYSWNGERYDHNVVWAPIMDVFQNMEESFKNLNIIRRGTGIMEFSDRNLIFRDFLNMTSPMSLEKFALSCCVFVTSKTTFPYEHFRDMRTLRAATSFPAYNTFRSSLCQNKSAFVQELEDLTSHNVIEGIWSHWSEVNKVFNFDPPIRFSSSENGLVVVHPEDLAIATDQLHTSPKKFFTSKAIFDETCTTMADYLKTYNMNDVILLVECVKSYAQGFFDTWGVNIHEQMSLPGVAQNLAFQFYHEKETAIYTFGKNFKTYNDQIRRQLHGGMTLAKSFKIRIILKLTKYFKV